jgi:hypothetical protein
MFGVFISEPKVLQSLKPRSSATMMRMFGGIRDVQVGDLMVGGR